MNSRERNSQEVQKMRNSTSFKVLRLVAAAAIFGCLGVAAGLAPSVVTAGGTGVTVVASNTPWG
jgi:hypothetical protein